MKQEGLRAEHDRQLETVRMDYERALAELQAQATSLKEAKAKLLDEFGQRSKEWRSEREASEVSLLPLQLPTVSSWLDTPRDCKFCHACAG